MSVRKIIKKEPHTSGKAADLAQRQQKEELNSLRGEQKEIAWGSQIRSYVFHPYSMVKDHRTGVEIGNIQAVMDGEIDPFLEAHLRYSSGLQSSNQNKK